MASIFLHNLLRTRSRDSYTIVGFTNQVAVDRSTVEGIWGESGTSPNIAPLQTLGNLRVNSKVAKI